ncbi:MAG: hypothetical protein Q6367_014120 [Candidatus Freyarchaeota archaeon]
MVTCPKHGARFDTTTGKVISEPRAPSAQKSRTNPHTKAKLRKQHSGINRLKGIGKDNLLTIISVK